MKLISIKKDKDGKHKFVAVFLLDNNRHKTTHFGAHGYEDFTTHHDKVRKALYLKRHEKNEDWNDPTSAGSLSRHILWHHEDLDTAIKDFVKKFNLI